jgi:hypothetical protein
MCNDVPIELIPALTVTLYSLSFCVVSVGIYTMSETIKNMTKKR